MSSKSSKSASEGSSLVRNLVLGLWIGVLAVGGAYLGVRLAARSQPQPNAEMHREVPDFLLLTESQLPSVQLLGEDGIPRPTEDFLGPQGTVVLFLDPNCDPCKFAARQWQQLYESGSMGEVEVLGISIADQESVDHYRAQLALGFPVVLDPMQGYVSRHGIDTYPWEIIVDGRGRVIWYTGDAQDMGVIANLGSLIE